MATLNDVKAQYQSLSAEDKLDFAKQFPAPGKQTSNALWLLVIRVFAAVALASTGALLVGMFIKIDGMVQPGLILSLFTGSTGFLIGIFAPSPAAGENLPGN